MAWKRNGNKYGNRKVVVDGIVYDSRKEAKRFQELLLLEKAGAIQNLQRQVKFVMIPAQYEKKWNTKKLEMVKGKCIERECTYIADFVYQEDGKTVVEDTKGFRTSEYRIKKKLMLFIHGIKIKET